MSRNLHPRRGRTAAHRGDAMTASASGAWLALIEASARRPDSRSSERAARSSWRSCGASPTSSPSDGEDARIARRAASVRAAALDEAIRRSLLTPKGQSPPSLGTRQRRVPRRPGGSAGGRFIVWLARAKEETNGLHFPIRSTRFLIFSRLWMRSGRAAGSIRARAAAAPIR
jgi:hypothetical protein